MSEKVETLKAVEKQYLISSQLLNDITNYLLEKPYKEVAGGLERLKALKEAPDAITKE